MKSKRIERVYVYIFFPVLPFVYIVAGYRVAYYCSTQKHSFKSGPVLSEIIASESPVRRKMTK